jgi:hypothetical protein
MLVPTYNNDGTIVDFAITSGYDTSIRFWNINNTTTSWRGMDETHDVIKEPGQAESRLV